jgi:hypothetical protein
VTRWQSAKLFLRRKPTTGPNSRLNGASGGKGSGISVHSPICSDCRSTPALSGSGKFAGAQSAPDIFGSSRRLMAG